MPTRAAVLMMIALVSIGLLIALGAATRRQGLRSERAPRHGEHSAGADAAIFADGGGSADCGSDGGGGGSCD